MQPILFSIGKFKLYSFGTFIALGALVAGLLMHYLIKFRKIRVPHLFDLVLYTLFFSLIGARIGYYLTYRDQFQSFWQIFYFWQGGLLALSGLITGFICFVYLVRRSKLPVWKMLDIAGLGFLLGWGVGKIGCHLSTCTVGRFTDSFLAVQASFPLDLFSTLWASAVFIILLIVWLKQKLSEGVIFFLALEAFFLGELLIKTLKADFGEGLVRIEAIIYLSLVLIVYTVFWKLHGPQISNSGLRLKLKNLFQRRN